jgi:hypothetical protein
MVYRTAEFRGKTVNLMITHYWADVAGSKTVRGAEVAGAATLQRRLGSPPANHASTTHTQVDYFCHKVKSGGGCPRINRLAIDRFRFGLQW